MTEIEKPVPWQCRSCGKTATARRGYAIRCTCDEVTWAPEWATPRDWDPAARPTPQQLADWLSRCTDWERLELATAMLRTATQHQDCLTRGARR